MSRGNILIVAGESEFAAQVMTRWQAEREVPYFTLASVELWDILLSSELSNGTRNSAYDLLIVGPQLARLTASLLGKLKCFSVPAIHVTRDAALLRSQGSFQSKLLLVPDRAGWLDEVILLSTEVLRRVEAVRAARRAERAAELSEHPAALGRYMLDLRSKITNALTSILGNAELLLCEPRQLPEDSLPRVETIQTMALRLNEIMQRFSSLASEYRLSEKHSQVETENLLEAVAASPEAT